MERFPGGFGRLLAQVVRATTPSVEVAVLGDPEDSRTRALLARVHREWHPNRTVAGGDPDRESLPEIPLFRGRGTVDGVPAAWVCRNFACEAPVTSADALESLLRGLD
jgi:uncharacterized protein YyaL (SSP411 family)